MKHFLSFLFVFTFISLFSQEADILIDGKYTGKNLYVLNPSFQDSFCIKSVLVNGKEIDFVKNSNAFEIPLEHFQLHEIISVQIVHHEECTPIIVNRSDLKQNREILIPSFMYVRKNKWLAWNINELDSGKAYSIEQFVYGKWLEIKNLGTPDTMIYNSFAPTLLTGNNFFRLREFDHENEPLISQLIKIKIPERHIEIKSLKVTKTVEFNDVTHYEIISTTGSLMKKGIAKTVEVSDLERGEYWLHFDNKHVVINKR